MKNTILIEVVEREINITRFETPKEARAEMKKRYGQIIANGCDDSSISDTKAYITDAQNHDNYDWRIYEL